MRILKPGEPCPCCGQSIPDSTPRAKILLLSYIAEGMSLMDVIKTVAEVLELPTLVEMEVKMEEAPAVEKVSPAAAAKLESAAAAEGAEKRAIVQRLKDYRAASGLGSLNAVSVKTAHFREQRISADELRDICIDRAPRMPMKEWRKITRALDALEASDPC